MNSSPWSIGEGSRRICLPGKYLELQNETPNYKTPNVTKIPMKQNAHCKTPNYKTPNVKRRPMQQNVQCFKMSNVTKSPHFFKKIATFLLKFLKVSFLEVRAADIGSNSFHFDVHLQENSVFKLHLRVMKIIIFTSIWEF